MQTKVADLEKWDREEDINSSDEDLEITVKLFSVFKEFSDNPDKDKPVSMEVRSIKADILDLCSTMEDELRSLHDKMKEL